jgi:hypothetical protein
MNSKQLEEKRQRFYELKQRFEQFHSPQSDNTPTLMARKKQTDVDEWFQ